MDMPKTHNRYPVGTKLISRFKINPANRKRGNKGKHVYAHILHVDPNDKTATYFLKTFSGTRWCSEEDLLADYRPVENQHTMEV